MNANFVNKMGSDRGGGTGCILSTFSSACEAHKAEGCMKKRAYPKRYVLVFFVPAAKLALSDILVRAYHDV